MHTHTNVNKNKKILNVVFSKLPIQILIFDTNEQWIQTLINRKFF